MDDKIRPQCGSFRGCQIHTDLGEQQCEMCREGRRKRAQEYRSRPEVRARDRAERRTLARLKRAFPGRYGTILEQEKIRALREEFGGQDREVDDV